MLDRKLKILIVEDSHLQGADLKEKLINYNYEVTDIVAAGELVMDSILNNKPDLILMDIFLAGELDGIQTVKIINIEYDIPVIFITSQEEDKKLLKRAKETNPYAYLFKPIHDKELFAIIELAISKYEIRLKLIETNKNLNERIKILKCLSVLSEIIESSEYSIERIFTNTIQIIPMAMMYPEISCSCISFDGKTYVTKKCNNNFSPYKAPIRINKEDRGFIAFCYKTDRDISLPDDIYTEEKRLLEIIAERLSKVIEKYELESQIIEHSKLLKKIIDSSPDSMVVTDLKNNIIECNDMAVKLFGYESKEDLLSTSSLNLIGSNFKNKAETYFEETISKERPNNIEFAMKRKDGTEFIGELSLGKISDNNSNPIYLIAVVKDITERISMENAIKKSIHEKEILLREIHHRVKNNIQIILSFFNLHYRKTKDKKVLEILLEMKNKIKVMAIVHEKLYNSNDFTYVSLKDFLTALFEDLIMSYTISRSRIKYEINIEDSLVSIDNAISCGLVINEIISNSIKYAFPENRKGSIKIIGKKLSDSIIELEIMDDGIGIPDNINLNNLETLGLRLTKSIVENQMSGSIELDNANGTKYLIKFEKQ